MFEERGQEHYSVINPYFMGLTDVEIAALLGLPLKFVTQAIKTIVAENPHLEAIRSDNDRRSKTYALCVDEEALRVAPPQIMKIIAILEPEQSVGAKMLRESLVHAYSMVPTEEIEKIVRRRDRGGQQ